MKKMFATGLAVIICMMSLSGCGSGPKVVMGTNAEFPPFEYKAEKGIVGKFSGVDVAIANEIAHEMNVKLKIENMPFDSLLLALPTGKVDFVAAGMTANDKRRESVDFSIPYYNATQYIIVREDDSSVASSADIIDKKVGVIDGYTGKTICQDTLKIQNLESYKKGTDAVMALSQSKVDAVVIDSHTALALVDVNQGLKIVKDPDVFETEEYAIAVMKGNTEMLNTVNKVLERLIKEGKIDEYVAKYTAEVGIDEN